MIKSKMGTVEVVGVKGVVLTELALLINTLSSKLTREEIMESVNQGLEMSKEKKSANTEDMPSDIKNFMEMVIAIIEGRM